MDDFESMECSYCHLCFSGPTQYFGPYCKSCKKDWDEKTGPFEPYKTLVMCKNCKFEFDDKTELSSTNYAGEYFCKDCTLFDYSQ